MTGVIGLSRYLTFTRLMIPHDRLSFVSSIQLVKLTSPTLAPVTVEVGTIADATGVVRSILSPHAFLSNDTINFSIVSSYTISLINVCILSYKEKQLVFTRTHFIVIHTCVFFQI